MRRKKPPVALMTVLVVSVVGLFIASGSWSFYTKSTEDQMKQLQEEAMKKAQNQMANTKPKAAASKEETKAAVADFKKSFTETGEGDLKPMRPGDKGGAGAPTRPSVVMPDQQVYKPTKNPAAPSGQWWSGK